GEKRWDFMFRCPLGPCTGNGIFGLFINHLQECGESEAGQSNSLQLSLAENAVTPMSLIRPICPLSWRLNARPNPTGRGASYFRGVSLNGKDSAFCFRAWSGFCRREGT